MVSHPMVRQNLLFAENSHLPLLAPPPLDISLAADVTAVGRPVMMVGSIFKWLNIRNNFKLLNGYHYVQTYVPIGLHVVFSTE